MKTARVIGLWALAALYAGPALAASAVRIDKDLQCRIQVGVGDTVRVGGMLPISIEFENAGDPRSLHVQTTGSPTVSAVFAVPKGAGTWRSLYLPVQTPSHYKYVGLTGVAFRDAEDGRLLKRVELGRFADSAAS